MPRDRAERAISQTLALLVVAVVVPTALLLFFATAAMRNEQLATRQQLLDMHHSELTKLHGQLVDSLAEPRAQLDRVDPTHTPRERFAAIARSGDWETAVIFGEDDRPAYPTAAPHIDPSAELQSRLQHFASQAAVNWLAAAGAWIEPSALLSLPQQALGVQQQVLHLLAAKQFLAAVELTSGQLLQGPLRDAVDTPGRSIACSTGLAVLREMPANPQSGGPPHNAARHDLAQRLTEAALDYQRPMLDSQRRFLLRELSALAPDVRLERQLHSEQLAHALLEGQVRVPNTATWRTLSDQLLLLVPSSDGRAVGALSLDRVRDLLTHQLDAASLALPSPIDLVPPDQMAAEQRQVALLIEPLSHWLDGWHLMIHDDSGSLFAERGRQRALLYGWTTALAVLAVGAIGGWASLALRRQHRLAQLKNDLLSTLSHELKTPVAAIRVLVDTLLARDCSPDQLREYLQMIGRENQRLDRLVQSFLSYGRIQRQQLALHRTQVEVADLVCRAVESFGDAWQAPDCHLNITIADGLPPIDADLDALSMALVNLLDNALKYTLGVKHIQIVADDHAGRIRITVRDNGVGFPPSYAQRIFEPFYQVDRTLDRAGEGFGLGLSIARGIALAHGGQLSASSVQGRGSEFVLTVPAANRTALVPHHQATQDQTCVPTC